MYCTVLISTSKIILSFRNVSQKKKIVFSNQFLEGLPKPFFLELVLYAYNKNLKIIVYFFQKPGIIVFITIKQEHTTT